MPDLTALNELEIQDKIRKLESHIAVIESELYVLNKNRIAVLEKDTCALQRSFNSLLKLLVQIDIKLSKLDKPKEVSFWKRILGLK